MPVTVTGDKALQRKFDALGEVAKGRTLVRALTAGGLIIQNDAKRNVPRVTGNLARSIHIGGFDDLNTDGGSITNRTGEQVPKPDEGNYPAIYIGTDVEYAYAIEFGDGQTPAQPYMRPAIDTTRSEVTREVGEALRDFNQGSGAMTDVAIALRTHLIGHAGLSALISTRVYPLQLPDSPTLPAVTYQRIDTMPLQHRSSQQAHFARPRFQVDGWAVNYTGVLSLRSQLRAAMGTFQQAANPRVDTAILKDDRDILESSPGRWRCSLDYHIWTEES